jgi:hypothetical protein
MEPSANPNIIHGFLHSFRVILKSCHSNWMQNQTNPPKLFWKNNNWCNLFLIVELPQLKCWGNFFENFENSGLLSWAPFYSKGK